MEAIVLAAGKGTRMCSGLPKVLHRALGKPVLGYVLDALKEIGIEKPFVVVGYKAQEVNRFLRTYGASPVFQAEQKGTGHAVMMAKAALKNAKGPVLVWPGDMPLVKLETLNEFINAHRKNKAHASVLSAFLEDPKGYGRIVREGKSFTAIREELDATAEERAIREVNTGIYLFEKQSLFEAGHGGSAVVLYRSRRGDRQEMRDRPVRQAPQRSGDRRWRGDRQFCGD